MKIYSCSQSKFTKLDLDSKDLVPEIHAGFLTQTYSGKPVHLFVDENFNTIKLAHLEVVNKDITKLDLVELQDLRYLSPEQVLTSK